ncbi:DUF475 domain-containing protein [Mycobacterium tuberculosis]
MDFASYEKLITAAHPQIAAFGGSVPVDAFPGFWVVHDRDIKWLKWIEVPSPASVDSVRSFR